MFIYSRVDFSKFRKAFYDYGRDGQFSIDALRSLYDYLEQMASEDTPIELDVIGLCCEWIEEDTKNVDMDELVNDTVVFTIGDDRVLYQVY